MLTADLVDVRRKSGELILQPFDPRAREEAATVASALLDTARTHEGRRREDLDTAWDAIEHEAERARMAKGLRKLAEDACVFEAGGEEDPIALRQRVFREAAIARREGRFDRAALLANIDERSLFADLKSEQLLKEAPTSNPAMLVEAYDLGRAQAVLLRATKVVCDIHAASAGPLRAFFARLKFHQLLFAAERLPDGYRVTIDGPFSMFDAGTKYGVRLAMLVPALREIDVWELAAEVRWGKDRAPLLFRTSSKEAGRGAAKSEPHLAGEVSELLEALSDAKWKVEPATTVLDVPGEGVCIPDLVFTKGKKTAYLEVLGFWSRDAVWKRVELAQKGLGAKVVFAASSRLRVSEEVLDKDLGSSLYIFKGKMSPRAVLEHIERITSGRKK